MSENSLDELQAICAKINSILQNKGILNAKMMTDKQSVDPQEVQARYTRGYQAWLEDDYVAAAEDFSWLTLYFPLEPHFHLALAGAMQMQQEFTLALSAYVCALLLEAKDPEPVYQMAVCFHAIERDADAREALQTAIEMSYLSQEYAPTAEKANLLLNSI
ncbi:TPA: CesD/SycD/LcrH family type III secretion system chaperone [Yersinia enterocolitica]|uniref:CesD/SycD/LcrH family type III secretion system chaperone n=1 Tax=Yersinia enterocolitica TaxID=630 RepID=UPI0021E797E8|nr:CesD/SycD/LcrH family type III secretion system chaperone [Yersinia enterocolitica]EKN3948358.1 CesD/SycD/LcrH family type III secretion system chaperone [Yersinia enterocolitica]EKN6314881.1 CesD/SycD/LcrH family type III secretion system chaperone [Yersinia enterocolitica]UYJ97125.1 CesD/SycD/LcrH family type III secretion system chaperone [Yersinia enterocolitica]HDL6884670.1 CesD/SycD/LcrH family type III secretion system chaperone [Yersinia enterocolitica]HDL6898039.1 CesD/SycD/LcrH fa